jgi:hypothetical protein
MQPTPGLLQCREEITTIAKSLITFSSGEHNSIERLL